MEDIELKKQDDELIKHLVTRLKDELGDVETYNKLHCHLKNMHRYEDAELVEEIAHDEFEHAEAIREILEELNYDFSEPGLELLWQRAYHIFHIH